MAEDKNQKIAEGVVAAVGGKDNISSALHCMTRLRLVLKDDGMADHEAIEAIPGVLKVVEQGGQLQVVIGQNVPKVHAAVVAMGVTSGGSVDDAPDAVPGEKKQLTPKGILDAVLGYLSGSMTPMIPVLMAAGLLKTIGVVLGPTMLGLVAADSNVITLFDFLYNAGFYFMPIYLGYNAAAKLGVTPVLGAYLGGILIAPAFVQMATDGAAFDVFGIPCPPVNYSSSVLPILLSVWVMGYVEKFFKRVIPDMLSTIFTPFLTILVMTPVSLCALAPLGSILGNFIGNGLFALGTTGGIVSIIGGALMCALWLPLVTTGMHVTIIMLAISSFMASGVDSFVLVCTNLSLWVAYGCELASALRLKNPDEKAEAFGYFVTNTVGGVGEPFIYGLLFKHGRIWFASIAGSLITGALAMILGVQVYNMANSSVLNLLCFMGGDPSNVTRAIICAVVGFATGFAFTWLFGFTREEIEGKQVA